MHLYYSAYSKNISKYTEEEFCSLPVVPASSKVDKKALPPVDLQKDAVEASALPKTQTEERLAKLWTEVLSRTAIDIQESFFDLGG